jgi:DNA-directed RNA polymerase subunit RPC12/RpoP
MIACASCGSTNLGEDACLDCGAALDAEARIAAWLDGPASSRAEPVPGPGPVAGCSACGYEGEMLVDAALGSTTTTCPACGVVIPARRTDAPARVTRVVACPECGREIGLSREDAGKTVICPGCSSFLGTLDVGPARRGHP